MKVQCVYGDNKMPQEKPVILRQCFDQGPGAGRAGAFAEDERRGRIESGNLIESFSDGFMEALARVAAVQCRNPPVETPWCGC